MGSRDIIIKVEGHHGLFRHFGRREMRGVGVVWVRCSMVDGLYGYGL
jgi:hypothetical protein